MGEFFTAPKLLEIGFDTLSAATALFVVATALRLSSSFTLSAHRRAMRVLAAAAVVVMAAEVAVAAAAAVLHYLYRVERQEIQPLRRSANVDALTGVGSRSFFERAARRRIEQATKNGAPLSCVLLDVDDFKAFNDAHGHEAGDEVLRRVAGVSSPTWPMPWWYWASS